MDWSDVMAEQRVPTVRLDDDGSFEPAPPGYPYACFLEVLPECRSGRGRFYRKDAQGYTNFPAQAGMWTGQAAFDRANPDKVAAYTLKMLKRRVPPAVPGIMFLSGGQSELESTLNLNAMNQKPNPW